MNHDCSRFSVITPKGPLPNLLRPDGLVDLRPADTFDAIEHDALRVWCNRNARYGLPTVELIEWLRALIGDRRAIEIGAGHGDFCRHLNIHGTDNKMQARPDIAAFYALTQQPVIQYPAWIEEIDAVDAVRRYKPDVVFGSWITHWIDPSKPMPEGGGNAMGVREDLILAEGVTYVMLGNLHVHRYKPIMRLQHKEHALPFLRSRASQPNLDRVFVWRP